MLQTTGPAPWPDLFEMRSRAGTAANGAHMFFSGQNVFSVDATSGAEEIEWKTRRGLQHLSSVYEDLWLLLPTRGAPSAKL
mmetsp:Transcript_133686/g.303226  ORF Transcript_133686/g.303226 Transcript_133686/m.303226 type:complete len:81 (-) Transcript_133686:592-834(-)